MHIFSKDDESNLMENSLEAMLMYQYPKMICRPVSDHDPPLDDDTTTKIVTALNTVWQSKFDSSPIVLED